MGRKERKRYEDNDHVKTLLDESKTRTLTADEIQEIRDKYTGAGGLVSTGWSNGQFFTPRAVTSAICQMLQIPEGSKIIEPSCGGGSFISALPEECHTLGIEMMQETARVAALINPQATIHQGDALEMLAEVENQFDYCLGNPPFMDIQHKAEYVGFEIAKTSRRAEWYFIELGLRALKPGGVMVFVVPDGILGSAKDKKNREWLMNRYWLRGVISLPNETFYHAGTSVKTSLLIVQKPFPGIDLKGKDYSIFMTVVKDIGWDSRGRSTSSELPMMVDEWQKLYPMGLGPQTPIILFDDETLDNLMAPAVQGQDNIIEEPAQTTSEAPQAKVVDMADYRVKKKKKKDSPQMAFDFEEVANG